MMKPRHQHATLALLFASFLTEDIMTKARSKYPSHERMGRILRKTIAAQVLGGMRRPVR